MSRTKDPNALGDTQMMRQKTIKHTRVLAGILLLSSVPLAPASLAIDIPAKPQPSRPQQPHTPFVPRVTGTTPAAAQIKPGAPAVTLTLHGSNLSHAATALIIDSRGQPVANAQARMQAGNDQARAVTLAAAGNATPGTYTLILLQRDNRQAMQPRIPVTILAATNNPIGTLTPRPAPAQSGAPPIGNTQPRQGVSATTAVNSAAPNTQTAPTNSSTTLQRTPPPAPPRPGRAAPVTASSRPASAPVSHGQGQGNGANDEYYWMPDSNAGMDSGNPGYYGGSGDVYTGEPAMPQPKQANPYVSALLNAVTQSVTEQNQNAQAHFPQQGGYQQQGTAYEPSSTNTAQTMVDLMLSDCQVHPENPVGSDSIYFSFALRNVGQSTASYGAGTTLYSATIANRPELGALDVTGALTVPQGDNRRRYTNRWQKGAIPPGRHHAVITFDPNNTVADANPANNTLNCSFVVSR